VFFGQRLPSRRARAAEDADIRQVACSAQHAGGRAADEYARFRRVCGFICGFVAGQNAPEAAALAPPPMEGRHVSIPAVLLAQEVPMSYTGRGAFRKSDHRTLFASCATWPGTLEDGSRAWELLDAAVRAVTSGCPGPGVLMLPKGMRAASTTPDSETPLVAGINAAIDRPRRNARQVEPRTVVLDVITDLCACPPIAGWDGTQHLHKVLPIVT
jgi:thiamine pyrophosphate-dependent acetolactate synthase large subunit-like protein